MAEEFVILGGGIAGVSAALELADKGHKVTIIERFDELLSGSSDDTPCRLGLGFHYIDIETAKKYLRSTIKVLRQYPKYVVGHNLPLTHPYRRGRYFVVNDTQFQLGKVLGLHDALKEEYATLINEDSANRVLGDPEYFSTILPLDKYQATVNAQRVVAALETAEQTLDWPKLKKHLIEKVDHHPNITVSRDTTVLGFTAGKNSRYDITVTPTRNPKESSVIEKVIQANFVVNSTWENIEKLNLTAGHPMQPNSRTNRTKVMIEIELPSNFAMSPTATLPETKDFPNSDKQPTVTNSTSSSSSHSTGNEPKTALSHAMFFCFGAHAAFTPIGKNKAFISYEPVTNVKDNNGIEQQTTGYEVSEFSKRLLAGQATDEEKEEYGQKVLAGIIQYIPGLAGSKVVGARFGNVRTAGTVDISDPNSPHHKRDKDCIETLEVGTIINPSMKLLYFIEGAKKLLELTEQQIAATEIIRDAIQNSTVSTNPHLASVVSHALDRSLDPNPAKLLPQKAIGAKTETLAKKDVTLAITSAINAKRRVTAELIKKPDIAPMKEDKSTISSTLTFFHANSSTRNSATSSSTSSSSFVCTSPPSSQHTKKMIR